VPELEAAEYGSLRSQGRRYVRESCLIPGWSTFFKHTPPHPATHFAPGPCQKIRALKNRGRRESRAPGAPAASRANEKSTQAKSLQVHRKRSGLPCANGFNGFLRALPGDRALLSPSSARCEKHRRQFSVSVGTPEPHDFAVRIRRVRLARHTRPSHPALNVRDDRDTPLMRGGTRGRSH
jgi:hypothetical protein